MHRYRILLLAVRQQTAENYPDWEFYAHGSVHRNSIVIRSNKMQQYACIYLPQNHSTCFGCPSYPSSRVHKTVTAASGTGHSIWATALHQHGRIRIT
jgi:Zn-finger protein